jgi:hypothetical protein
MKISCNVNMFHAFCASFYKTIEYQYPLKVCEKFFFYIKIESIYGPKQLGFGQFEKIRIDIRNFSLQNYGISSNEHFLVSYSIKLKGDLHFSNFNENTLTKMIEFIPSNGSITIEEEIVQGYETQFFDFSVISIFFLTSRNGKLNYY